MNLSATGGMNCTHIVKETASFSIIGKCAISVCSFVGIVVVIGGNTLTLIAIRKYRWLQTCTNALVASLAVCDCIVGIMYPVRLMKVYAPALIKLEWHCLLIWSILLFPEVMSIHMLIGITVERYIYILYPLKHMVWVTSRGVKAYIFLCVLLTFAVLLALLFANSTRNNHICSCFTDMIALHPLWLQVVSLTFSLAILAMMIYMYGHIYREVRRQERNIIQVHTIGDNQCGPYKNNAGRKSMASITLTVGVSTFCWFSSIAFHAFLSQRKVGVAVVVDFIFNYGVNVLFYSWKNRQFLSAFNVILKLSKSHQYPDSSDIH